MRDLQTAGAIRAALQYVISTEMPANHKAILIETLTEALRTRQAADEEPERGERPWQREESAHLESALRGRIAKSWQDADESLMHLALQLHRPPAEVRTMAAKLGVGPGVDYALAKKCPRPSTDE